MRTGILAAILLAVVGHAIYRNQVSLVLLTEEASTPADRARYLLLAGALRGVPEVTYSTDSELGETGFQRSFLAQYEILPCRIVRVDRSDIVDWLREGGVHVSDCSTSDALDEQLLVLSELAREGSLEYDVQRLDLGLALIRAR